MLTIQNASAVYPDKTCAIADVNITLNAGESAALLGENGAGKSSLFLAILGILPLTSGEIIAGGTPLSSKTLPQIRRQIGLIFQNPDDQLFMPTIEEDVAFGCQNIGLSTADTEERVTQNLEKLGISHLRHRSPLKLSGGEKRMAALASVLAMEPKIILFDEPTAFLDSAGRRRLIQVMSALSQTLLIATHDLPFAAALCQRTLIMKNGRIQENGNITLLKNRSFMNKYDFEPIFEENNHDFG